MATLRTLRGHYRDARSVEAVDALDDPNSLSALPSRDSQEIVLQIFFIPSFEPISSWTIYRVRESCAHVRRVRWDFDSVQCTLVRICHFLDDWRIRCA